MQKDNFTDLLEVPRDSSSQANKARPALDPAKYRAEIDNFDLTEEQKDELLGIL